MADRLHRPWHDGYFGRLRAVGLADPVRHDRPGRAVPRLGIRGRCLRLRGPRHSDPHPYLQPDTAAFNVIDAVRAARNVVPDTSTRWATLGLSQGGQASWAAAEEADTYGDGLEFVGAANLSPAADISPIISVIPR
ncbi:lipase family protein [Rhodococcus sp. 3Y1]